MTRNPMFLKYMFCKISFLCILGKKCNSPRSLSLHVVYSIYSGVEIRGEMLTRHTFTNLLKSIS